MCLGNKLNIIWRGFVPRSIDLLPSVIFYEINLKEWKGIYVDRNISKGSDLEQTFFDKTDFEDIYLDWSYVTGTENQCKRLKSGKELCRKQSDRMILIYHI